MNQTSHDTNLYWPLGQLILARLREFIREPEALFWVYGFPILMTVLLGIAFRNQSIEGSAVDVIEGPRAAATRDALATSGHPERFKVEIHSAAEAGMRLRTGKIDVIVDPNGNSADQGDQLSPPQIQYEYRFDTTRPQSVLAQRAVDDQLQRALGRSDVANVSLVPVEEAGGRYIDFLVPGLLGMGLMGGGLWGVGFVTVDMRIRKLLKRFLATPMKKSHFLGAIMGSRLIFMIPEVLVLLVFARIVFGVKIHGSILTLTFLIVIGAVMFAGIGLLVASRAKTIEAVSGLMNLVMLPMWVLSGIFFSSERFPDFAQPVIKAVPLTPLIDALRSVMLEGAPLSAQLSRLAIMIAWGVVCFVLALKWFRWQ
jgi:ABC-type multidrug transport system permease subunit